MDWQSKIGKTHKFEDGRFMRLVQIKDREGGPWMIWEVTDPPGNPRRFYTPLNEFAMQFESIFFNK